MNELRKIFNILGLSYQDFNYLKIGSFTLFYNLKAGFGYIEPMLPDEEMSNYYDKNYYTAKEPKFGIKYWLRKNIFVHSSFLRNFIDILIEKKCFSNKDNLYLLDFGCGNGEKLLFYKMCGFKNLYGVEPFNTSSIDGIFIVRSLKEISNLKFDIIILSHVLEHLLNPLQTLEVLKAMLKEGGRCI